MSQALRRILGIGHRGAKAIAKDNTMDSFRKALSFKLDMIEFDINLTRDDVLVVFHDQELHDGRRIRDITFEDFVQNDPDHISLRTMLTSPELSTSGIRLYFDLKDPAVTLPLMIYIKELVREGIWRPNQLWIASFDLNQAVEVKNIRDADPTLEAVRVGGIFEDLALNPAQTYEAMGLQFISVEHVLVTEALIRDAHERGIHVFSWTVNSEEVCERLVSIGIDGLCGDNPELIAKHRTLVEDSRLD
jgi:glycerophosphoryl diester phosphodiesterase